MFDPASIIKAIGLIGIFLVIFTETGLLVGFFLPGDSILFTAGIFASQGFLNIYVLLIGCIVAAILGDSLGYFIGKKYGRKVFNKEESFFFKRAYLLQTEQFYKKHGKYTITIARFVPIVRTFAPVVGGVGNMRYRSFLFYNILGGILWVTSVLFLGYFLGGLIPGIEGYLIPIVLLIIVFSFIPIIIKILRNRLKKKKTQF